MTALAKFLDQFAGHLSGTCITPDEATELQGVGMPGWLTQILEVHPLVGTEWYLAEHVDESGFGVEMQLMSAAEVLNECRNAMPGQVACRFGFIPFGKCLVGSGDPYFLVIHPASQSASLVRVPHEISEDEMEAGVELVSRALHLFFEQAELG